MTSSATSQLPLPLNKNKYHKYKRQYRWMLYSSSYIENSSQFLSNWGIFAFLDLPTLETYMLKKSITNIDQKAQTSYIGYVVVSIKSIIPAKITISTSDSLDIDNTYIETPTVTAIPVTKFRGWHQILWLYISFVWLMRISICIEITVFNTVYLVSTYLYHYAVCYHLGMQNWTAMPV